MSEITHLSYSAIRLFLDCPRAFMYRYLRRYPTTLNGRMLAGRVYHHGVEFALKLKMAGMVCPVEQVKDVVANNWDAQLSEKVAYEGLEEPRVEAAKVDWGDEKPGEIKDAIIDLAGIYVRDTLPTLQPVAVEKRLEKMILGVPFVGYPDVILAGNGVADNKLRTKRMSQEEADRDIQVTSYAALLEKPIWFAFHQALDQKERKVEALLTQRDLSDVEWFETLVMEVWGSIQTGIFPPNPLTWRCPGCSYSMECKFIRDY